MLGHGGFSGSGFSASVTKISNGEVVDISAKVETKLQRTGTIFTKLSTVGSILLKVLTAGTVVLKRDSTLNIKRLHELP